MSMRYKGGVISATPPTTSQTSASGAWTLEQQMQANAAGNWPKNGPFNWIEDVFSTWLYTGNGSTQTITNGVDLAGKGGLVWIKSRSNALQHTLIDTVRGQNRILRSNNTDAQSTSDPGTGLTSFNSTGFTLGPSWSEGTNSNGVTNVSWTFRDQAKFFDVVTYTGTGVTRAVAHNLGSTPGCIIVKRTNAADSWFVWHRGLSNPAQSFIYLNLTNEASTSAGLWGNTAPTSTGFTVGGAGVLNESGATYVAYLFAHNAGGFGLSGNENVISCGSFTQVSGVANVTLGYEPQWVLIKRTDAADNWTILDNMRGVYSSVNTPSNALFPNTSGAESSGFYIGINATGFDASGLSTSGSYIYIAIRRGPMAVPTTGTSVFNPSFNGQTSTNYLAYLGQPTDFWIRNDRAGGDHNVRSRLTGGNSLLTNSTAAETASSLNWWDNQLGVGLTGSTFGYNDTIINYLFRRAPGFMDVCCYSGTGVVRTVAHNLTVVPELMIVKRRNSAASWWVYAAPLGATKQLVLNTDAPENIDSTVWNDTAPTATQFTLGTLTQVNGSGSTFVAYLFASAPGVSKVGNYTGNDVAGRIIDCGFTSGARFVLLKCTSQSGDWFVWDSARGITSGNDPYLLLNSTAAEVTGTNYVDTHASGFRLNAFNSAGDQFIFLAIA